MQKIALACGFVRDARLIFLDEHTASLDAKTEKAVFEQVLSLAEDKTAIVISHRLFITPLTWLNTWAGWSFRVNAVDGQFGFWTQRQRSDHVCFGCAAGFGSGTCSVLPPCTACDKG